MKTQQFEKHFQDFLRRFPHAPQNEDRFPALLTNAIPNQKKLTGPIIYVWKAGLSDELEQMRFISKGFAARYADQLAASGRITPEQADWAVRVWIVCYGQDILGKETDVFTPSAEAVVRAETLEQLAQVQTVAVLTYRSARGVKIVTGCRPPIPAALVVPERYEDMPVRAVDPGAFRETDVQFVILGAGIRTIGEEAFAECRSLKQAVLPEGLKILEKRAFFECDSLQSAPLPQSVDTIGDEAFAGAALPEAVIGDNVVNLGEGVFERCPDVTEADVGTGIRDLPQRTFAGCDALAYVDLPVGLERINTLAFADCPSLRELRIPDSVHHIEDGAFSGDSEDLTLIGRRKSVAEYYARRNGLWFRAVF